MIPFTCPGCRRETHLGDDMAGKKAFCPSCGAEGVAPADEIVAELVERPARQPRPKAAAPQKKGGSGIAVLVVSAVALALGGGGVFAAVYLWPLLYPPDGPGLPAPVPKRGGPFADGEWQTLDPAGLRFTVSLPGRASPSEGKGEPGRRFVLQRTDANVVYAVEEIALPGQTASPALLSKIHEGDRAAMASAMKGRAVAENDVTLGAVPGKGFRIEAGDGTIMEYRLYVAGAAGGARAWVLRVGGDRARVEGADGQRFLDSFKLKAGHDALVKEGPPKEGRPKTGRPKTGRPRGEDSPLAGSRPPWAETSSDRALALAFSPNGETLAAGHFDHRIRLWDVAGAKDRSQHRGRGWAVYCVAYRPDGKRLAYGMGKGAVVLWDTESDKEAGRFRLEGERDKEDPQVHSLAYSADGRFIAAGIQPAGTISGEVHVWDVEGKRLVAAMRDCGEIPWKMAYSKDGAVAAYFHHKVRLCDPKTLAVRREIKAATPAQQLAAADLSPDGKTLLTACADKKLRVYDVGEGAIVSTWDTEGDAGGVASLAHSPDGALAVLGVRGPALCLIDPKTGKNRVVALARGSGKTDWVTFSHDGRWLAALSSAGPRIFETATLRALLGP